MDRTGLDAPELIDAVAHGVIGCHRGTLSVQVLTAELCVSQTRKTALFRVPCGRVKYADRHYRVLVQHYDSTIIYMIGV